MAAQQQKQIKVFYVPFSYRGFTEDLLTQSISGIKNKDYSGMLYLAPTPGKIRAARRIFHSVSSRNDRSAKNVYIPPEMMTIKQFSKRLYYLYGEKNLLPETLMPIIISRLSGKGIGFSSIIGNFIDEIKQYRPLKDIESVQVELNDIFKSLNVPEEGSKRALEALEVFRSYQKIMDRHNAVDENDIMEECPDLAARVNYSADTLILDSFYEITPSEELILKKLIEDSKTTLVSIPYDENFTPITDRFTAFIKHNFPIEEIALASEKRPVSPSYNSYPGLDEEVEGIARHIKNLFVSGRCRSLNNIILTFPKLSAYSHMVERVFRRYGIPCTFSLSRPAGKTRPFLDLTAMLEAIADDYPRLPFSQFLISPYFKKMPEIFREYIPQISLNSGIIKGKNSWLNLTKTLECLPPELEQKIKWIFKKLAPLESLKEKGTYKQFCDMLDKLLTELDFADEDIDLKEQSTCILKELALIDNLCLTASDAGLRQFIDGLKHVLNTVKTETEGAGVQVMGFFELRGLEPEYLYIGGLKDGDLPSMPDIDLIFPDNVRTKLGLVNMKRYLNLQKFIFRRMTDSSKNLLLSYPAAEADKMFLPSPFLPWNVVATAQETPGILCREEELLGQGKKLLSAHIKEIGDLRRYMAGKYFGVNSHMRVTDIDSYRTCPRKFFIEKILKLEPPETNEYKIETMLLGAIIHKIMEHLISKTCTTFDEMRLNAENLFKKVLEDQPLEDYWKNFIRDSFLSILPSIYEIENKLADEGFSFMEAEVSVEGEIIKGIKLKGKIDRVDKQDNVIELIDYKTGSAQLNRLDIVNKGASLQLFLYAALMKSLGFKVERVGIYSLKDLKVTWIPGRNDKREGKTMEDYITTGMKYLEATVSGMRDGDFIASPMNEQTCRNCHERPYCPYIQTSS
ncbi:MAG: PD-(D/E)XK nuclease family protein [Nitrospirae bacterium]|nr:MAG: PD-(D/E)XK nuclease family protein [Nitrospirota bacterium]